MEPDTLLHIPDDFLITWLYHRCCVWWQEFHGCGDLLTPPGGCCKKHDWPYLPAHFAGEITNSVGSHFTNSVGSDFRRHTCILIGPVADWKTFPTKTSRFLALLLMNNFLLSLQSILGHLRRNRTPPLFDVLCF